MEQRDRLMAGMEEMQQCLDPHNYKIRRYEDGAMAQAAMEERQARSPEG